MSYFSQSGLLLLYTALSQIVCTLHPECVIVFVITSWKLNGSCFPRHIGFVVWHRWIPRTVSSPHLWSPDLRTRHVKVYVFIFLWENRDVVRLRAAVESYTEPWSPGGNAFSQRPTVPNLDQDWNQWGAEGGGGVLRLRNGWDFMYLAWNDPTRLSSDQTLFSNVWRLLAPLCILELICVLLKTCFHQMVCILGVLSNKRKVIVLNLSR